MTADLTTRLRDDAYVLRDDLPATADLLREAADAIDSLTAERDNLVIAVTRCNDEHVLKSDLAAAQLVVEAARKLNRFPVIDLDQTEQINAFDAVTDALTAYEKAYSSKPCAKHPWIGDEARCVLCITRAPTDEERGYLDRAERGEATDLDVIGARGGSDWYSAVEGERGRYIDGGLDGDARLDRSGSIPDPRTG